MKEREKNYAREVFEVMLIEVMKKVAWWNVAVKV